MTAPKAATCAEAGNSDKHGTCTRCGQTITGTLIPALGHHAPNGTYPTCIADGNTGIGFCQRQGCGAFVAGTMIPALRPGLGHDHTSSLICKREGCYHRYTIGDEGPAGGIIFYVAPSGFTVTGYGSPGDTDYFAGYTAYYLEAALLDHGELFWMYIPPSGNPGDEYHDIKGTGTVIGTGKENTRLILATDPDAPAAKVCDEYSNNGKTDWFLPSKDELNEMYKARSHLGITVQWDFWSSSQDNSNKYRAWAQYFGNDSQGDVYVTYKDCKSYVRAIRAF